MVRKKWVKENKNLSAHNQLNNYAEHNKNKE